MRKFSETQASKTPEPEWEPTLYLRAEDVKGVPLIAISANLGSTDYGDKAFLHVYLPGEENTADPARYEYTISFTSKSYAYPQIQSFLKEEANGEHVFPLYCTVVAWQKRSYQLTDASDLNDENRLTSRYLGARSRKQAAEAKAANAQQEQETPF